MSKSRESFEFNHFYPEFKPHMFWDFHVDHEWYTKSDIMIGEIDLLKEGKDHSSGLGAVRKLTIGNIKLEEDIVAYDAPSYFSYAVREGGMPVKNYVEEFFFESKDNGLLLRYKGSFSPKPFGTNWLFKYIFRSRMQKMIPIWEKGYKAYHNKL